MVFIKKLALFSVLLFLLATLSLAQSQAGLKGGFSFHKETFSTDSGLPLPKEENDYQAFPSIELLADIQQLSFLSHTFSAGYFQAGGADVLNPGAPGEGAAGEKLLVTRLGYVTAGYAPKLFLPTYPFYPFLSPGIYLDYLVSSRMTVDSGGESDPYDFGLPYEELNKWNVTFSPSGGLGYKYGPFTFQVSYSLKYYLIPFYSALKIKHSTFGQLGSLTVMYRL